MEHQNKLFTLQITYLNKIKMWKSKSKILHKLRYKSRKTKKWHKRCNSKKNKILQDSYCYNIISTNKANSELLFQLEEARVQMQDDKSKLV